MKKSIIQKILISICLSFSIYSLLFSQEESIILENKFINQNESISGTDVETNYKLIDMNAKNPYNHFIIIDLLEK